MIEKQCTETLGELIGPYARRVEADLKRWLLEPDTPAALAEAMRYCVLDGGKRLRPALVHLAAEAVCGEASELAHRSAVAVELVHCYSLVHDDLPAMDDDLLRRGRPTAHVRFGEAMAVLTGDGLLTRAFSVLAESEDERIGRLVATLAGASGPAGMIAGQVADMDLCDVPAGADGVRYIHLRKTALLIRAAAAMGAICGGAGDVEQEAIRRYGESLGLAFQLVDDLLDVTAGAEQLGKTPGKDARSGKRTHVAKLGVKRTRQTAEDLTQRAINALKPMNDKYAKLCGLARLLAERTH